VAAAGGAACGAGVCCADPPMPWESISIAMPTTVNPIRYDPDAAMEICPFN
jgi:hypothetical protein